MKIKQNLLFWLTIICIIILLYIIIISYIFKQPTVEGFNIKKFFRRIGNTIKNTATNVVNKTVDAVKTPVQNVVNEIKNTAIDSSNKLVDTSKTVGIGIAKTGETVSKEVKNVAIEAAEETKRVAEKTAADAKRVAEKAAEETKKAALRAIEEAKKLEELANIARKIEDIIRNILGLVGVFKSIPPELKNFGNKIINIQEKTVGTLKNKTNQVIGGITSLGGDITGEMHNIENYFKSIPSIFENKLKINL